MFSGVLYPQMRPPTKQASRFRSTAKKNRPSLTSWDLVWPLVFKLLCHVSSNWYLMFSLPPLQPRNWLHFVFVPKSWLASSHCLCVSEPGAKSEFWFILWTKCAFTVLCYMIHPVFWTLETEDLQQPRNSERAGPSSDFRDIQAYVSEPKTTQTPQHTEI